jgi:Zn-dependent peptidase ImmA (M78 family)/DNA-binding XRE family transcriptional regulator
MIGKRIQRARKAMGLSLRDLALQAGISHAMVKKYEDDKTMPSSDMLIKLSKALHTRTAYFFRQERFTLSSVQYRKHADMPEKQLTEISAKILDHIERRIELESLFPNSQVQLFSVKNLFSKTIQQENEIEILADKIRADWNLGLDPVLDLIDIFEEHGIKVFEIDNQQYPKFDGLSAHINNIPVIVIGNQWPGDRQRFTLAHELGHLVLEQSLSSDMSEEKCCNRFAGAFLLPQKTLISVLGEHRSNIEPRELSLLKQEFGISMLGILHRAEDTGIISNSLSRKLRLEFNHLGWEKLEPGEQYPQEKTHIFEKMIFHALAEDYIGESKAAELMNMSIESFRLVRMIQEI